MKSGAMPKISGFLIYSLSPSYHTGETHQVKKALRGDFEIRVQAPTGKTMVECVRGCKVIGARDVDNPSASQMRSYWFSCGAPDGCQGRVVGFLQADAR